jgi:large subunit ribosomal protein L10
MVGTLRERLAGLSTAVIVDYQGLSVEETNALRRQLRDVGASLLVVKNSLLARAAENTPLADVTSFLEGPTALTLAEDDPVGAAKVLLEFAKEHPALEFKGTILEGAVISEEDLKALSELPNRETMLSILLATFNAPIQSFVRVLNAPLQGLLNVLDAIRRQKEDGAD